MILNPETVFVPLSNLGFLSPDSQCHSFTTKANGYARGEGVAVLVLKRLSRALAEGDTIRAVIRGTHTNQDGKTPGITQPSLEAQKKLITSCYSKARLALDQTRVFEAHGTGTTIGDSVEASAIREVFKSYRDAQTPMIVGAVKSNIGHLEGASGLAGVVKSILTLETGLIPPNARSETSGNGVEAQDWGLLVSLFWPCYFVLSRLLDSIAYSTNADNSERLSSPTKPSLGLVQVFVESRSTPLALAEPMPT